MVSQLEKLKAEEAEAEAQMFGTTVAPTEPTAPTAEQVEAERIMQETITGKPPEVAPVVSAPPPEPQPEPKKRTNWKNRFSTYKASTDTTIFELRNEVASLKADLASAITTVQSVRAQEVQGDPWEGVFTQEDEDAFGTEGLDVVKKATNKVLEKQVKPLQDRLAAQEKQRADQLASQANEANVRQYGEFIKGLQVLVPNYAELNKDQGFLEWMKHPDPYSGLQRNKLFLQAEAGRDVARVAEFFVEYSQTKAKPPQSPLEQHITPVGSGSAAPVSQGNQAPEVIYTSEIDTFYSDVMKGRYKGREKEVAEIEAKIDRASMIPGAIKQG